MPCVLEASAESQPMNVVVSVYLYDAGVETTYRGAFLSEFMGGARGHEMKVDYTIEPRKQPTALAAAGRVTSTPGQYEFKMALLAEVPGQTDPHQFARSVPVRVVAADAARGSF
jgi:hypothetical protein